MQKYAILQNIIYETNLYMSCICCEKKDISIPLQLTHVAVIRLLLLITSAAAAAVVIIPVSLLVIVAVVAAQVPSPSILIPPPLLFPSPIVPKLLVSVKLLFCFVGSVVVLADELDVGHEAVVGEGGARRPRPELNQNLSFPFKDEVLALFVTAQGLKRTVQGCGRRDAAAAAINGYVISVAAPEEEE